MKSAEWLELNYNTDNDLPGFYLARNYGFDSRVLAEADYKESVVSKLVITDTQVIIALAKALVPEAACFGAYRIHDRKKMRCSLGSF